MSLIVIMVGFIMFNIVPTPTPEPVTEEEGHDNQAAELDDEIQVSSEVESQRKTDSIGKSISAENRHGCVLSSVQM